MISKYDVKMLNEAVKLSKNCPKSEKAYSVGAIIVDDEKNLISTGYSRETADNVHAEEVAINKSIEKNIGLSGATIYSTMEPCGLRLSGKLCCADKIINAGIKRVVYGIKEPPFFVNNTTGIDKLMSHGIIVEQVETEEIINSIKEVNNHIT